MTIRRTRHAGDTRRPWPAPACSTFRVRLAASAGRAIGPPGAPRVAQYIACSRPDSRYSSCRSHGSTRRPRRPGTRRRRAPCSASSSSVRRRCPSSSVWIFDTAPDVQAAELIQYRLFPVLALLLALLLDSAAAASRDASRAERSRMERVPRRVDHIPSNIVQGIEAIIIHSAKQGNGHAATRNAPGRDAAHLAGRLTLHCSLTP